MVKSKSSALAASQGELSYALVGLLRRTWYRITGMTDTKPVRIRAV
jgi:hypothetical protein